MKGVCQEKWLSLGENQYTNGENNILEFYL